jgi:hypothetical protein
LLIVKLLQTTTAYKNNSDPDHEAVISCILDITRSDRGLPRPRSRTPRTLRCVSGTL